MFPEMKIAVPFEKARHSSFILNCASSEYSLTQICCNKARGIYVEDIETAQSSWNVMAHGDAGEGKWREKLANGMGSQYPSHYLETRCIQNYYRWCRTVRLPAVDWSYAPHRADLNGLVRFCAKDGIWFLRMWHHISAGLYIVVIWFRF